MKITQIRKFRFYEAIGASKGGIAVIDVGSGGPLKEPWNQIPEGLLTITGFEPTAPAHDSLCISNHSGHADFFVAHDERSSSLHELSEVFMNRFGYPEMVPRHSIRVKCTTLDEFFRGSVRNIDALDINVEGHDFQVLQGAQEILNYGWVKLMKVEFELTEVYEGQGWFSDIDNYLRPLGFDLVDIEIDHSKPLNVRSVHCKGEPLWGKAIYVPSSKTWHKWLTLFREESPELLEEEVLKSIVLYVAADVPGRAMDILDMSKLSAVGNMSRKKIQTSIAEVYRCAKLDKLSYLLRRGALSLLRIS